MSDLLTELPVGRRSASHGESGFERRPMDAYFTPKWCTEALLDHIAFPLTVHEPMCGDGHITGVLRKRGHTVIDSDVFDYGCCAQLRDFLSFGTREGIHAIVSNPPYEGGERFLAQALSVTASEDGKVAMLLRHEYDCAKSRRYLFADHKAFAHKLTLTKRPRWSDVEKASPRFPFAWFVWDWTHRGAPTLGYAP